MQELEHVNKIEHVEIHQKISTMSIQMEANFDVMSATLNGIKETTTKALLQAEKTNGRVTQLEKDIDFIRFFKNNKFIFLISVFGAIKIIDYIDVAKLITKIITLF